MSIDHSDEVGWPAEAPFVHKLGPGMKGYRRPLRGLNAYGVPKPRNVRPLWLRALEQRGSLRHAEV